MGIKSDVTRVFPSQSNGRNQNLPENLRRLYILLQRLFSFLSLPASLSFSDQILRWRRSQEASSSGSHDLLSLFCSFYTGSGLRSFFPIRFSVETFQEVSRRFEGTIDRFVSVFRSG